MNIKKLIIKFVGIFFVISPHFTFASEKEIDQFISILSQLWSQLDEAYEKMLNTMKSNLLTLFDYEMSSSLKKVQSRG